MIDVTTLGRQDQDLRHHRRPRPAAGLRPDAEAGARRAERRQHQCRRQHRQLGPQSAVIRSVGQIRSMDDIRHTMLVMRDGAPVLVGDVADDHGGLRAAARHRRPRRRQRHRRGHRADAARRGDPADPARGRAGGRARSTRRTSCRPACDRAHLRPQRPGRRHHPHRAAQHGDGRLRSSSSSSGCSWATCAAR